jgi:hypothetical protein
MTTRVYAGLFDYQMLFSDQACCPVMRQEPPTVMATAGSMGVRA